ncbi:MAG: hypothetical protein ACPGYX_06340 [Oceanobacter sp.]
MNKIYAYSENTNQKENDKHILDLFDKYHDLYAVGGCHGDQHGKPTGHGIDGYIFAKGDQKSRKTGSGINYTYKNLSGQTSSGPISESNEKYLAELIEASLDSRNAILCWCHSYTWIKNYITNDPILRNRNITIVDISGIDHID